MIISDVIKIKFTKDNLEIENELLKLGIEPLRWAIVEVQNDSLLLNVSYEVSEK